MKKSFENASRPVDVLVSSTEKKMNLFQIVSKSRVKLWKALLASFFVAGFVGAMALVVGFNMGIGSDAKTVTPVVAGIDLVAVDVTMTTTEMAKPEGTTVNFSATVVIRNQGSSNATKSNTRFCLDNTNCLNSNKGMINSELATKALNKGVSQKFSVSKIRTTLGKHTLTVCADVKKTVKESNENNNCSTYEFKFIPAPQDISCTDSDGGKDYYVKGTADDGVTVGEDVCDFTMVKERYCDSQSKFATESYICPNGCKDGACIKAPTSCTDSDGGVKEFIYGYAKDNYGAINYDYCEGNNLREQICSSSGSMAYKDITCGNGCIDGVCKKSTGNDNTTGVTCTDSDNGEDFYVYGSVKHGSNGSYIDNDVCTSNVFVMENFCGKGYYAKELFTCPNGCKDGACIKDAVVKPDLKAMTVSNGRDLVAGEKISFNGLILNKGKEGDVNSRAQNPTYRFCMDNANCLNSTTGRIGTKDDFIRYDVMGGTSAPVVSDFWTVTSGQHTLSLCADPSKKIAETNEDNNCEGYQFVVSADRIVPTINSLNVETGVGSNFQATVFWEASDTGGSFLDRVEVWRATGSTSPTSWMLVYTKDINTNVNSNSGSWVDTVTTSGTYWYGLHVFDNAGNIKTEVTPIRVQLGDKAIYPVEN